MKINKKKNRNKSRSKTIKKINIEKNKAEE